VNRGDNALGGVIVDIRESIFGNGERRHVDYKLCMTGSIGEMTLILAAFGGKEINAEVCSRR
jgi:hypothetical protein